MVKYDQSGYVGQSMSVRADKAYQNGERPASRWGKSEMLAAAEVSGADPKTLANMATYTVSELRRDSLVKTSWHHTGKMANATDFFSIREADDLAKIFCVAAKEKRKLDSDERKESVANAAKRGADYKEKGATLKMGSTPFGGCYSFYVAGECVESGFTGGEVAEAVVKAFREASK